MKLIFLDIDGVLNSTLFWREYPQADRRKYYKTIHPEGNVSGADIDKTAIEMLNKMVGQTGCQIVISSTWRRVHELSEIQSMFEHNGFNYQIFGKTPILKCQGLSVPRGLEIKAFLINNFPDHKERDKVRYVILDDDSDMLLWQKDNYFQVDPYCGLTPSIVYRATRFLNREG